MFFRTIIISLMLLAGSGAVLNSNIHASQTAKAVLTYTYERVLIDGVWWINVYNEYGVLVDSYPDPNQ